MMKIYPNWKIDWVNSTGYSFSAVTSKDWFIGRASVPLICVEKLKQFGLEHEVGVFMQKIRYISSSTNEVVKVPKTINPDLIYLSGLILGDGSLPISHRKNEGNLLHKLWINAKVGTTNYLCNKYYQHDFRIPKSEVGKFKEVLSERYLPYRKDRLDTINALAGVR